MFSSFFCENNSVPASPEPIGEMGGGEGLFSSPFPASSFLGRDSLILKIGELPAIPRPAAAEFLSHGPCPELRHARFLGDCPDRRCALIPMRTGTAAAQRGHEGGVGRGDGFVVPLACPRTLFERCLQYNILMITSAGAISRSFFFLTNSKFDTFLLLSKNSFRHAATAIQIPTGTRM